MPSLYCINVDGNRLKKSNLKSRNCPTLASVLRFDYELNWQFLFLPPFLI